MNKIQANLDAGEEIIASGVIAKFVYWSGAIWIALGILFLLAAGVGLLFIAIGIYQILKAKSIWVVVTNKKLTARKGIIMRDIVDVSLNKIESINIKQGLFGRMFSYGTLVITGIGESKIKIPYISTPQDFRRKAVSMIETK